MARRPCRLPPLSEDAFLAQVLALARLRGWRCHHQRPARTKSSWRTAIAGSPGFVDLVLVRPPVLIFAELKTDQGRLSAAQRAWIEALGCCGVEVYTWRPGDWSQIEEVLA